MPGSRQYDIAIVGLKQGVHEYTYEVDDLFFVEKSKQDFTHCKAQVKLTLDKHEGFMMLTFEVGGEVDLPCDRCGNPLRLPIWDDFEILVKMADDPDELNGKDEDPDVFYISRTESHLHVADWLYEFILLSIPTQRTCGEDESGASKCNPVVLEMLRKMEEESQEQKPEETIWKGLDKFRNT
jgi:uncharacterized metal-binding protein YceD (DUF177 family)